jgi:hypothetical protein
MWIDALTPLPPVTPRRAAAAAPRQALPQGPRGSQW